MIRKTAAAILLALTVAAALTHSTYVLASTEYDGLWSVVVYTTSGQCDPSYRVSGEITNGEISYAYGSLEVTGHVERSGATHVHVTYGDAHGEAHGHMTATHGSGTWSGNGPNGHCSGTWTATRGGAS
jgi:hypothetical protein